jgi:hypothetical protein
MKINFGTKEESKVIQIDDFLKLSKTDRIYAFINLLLKSKQLPRKKESDKSDNFLIEIKTS